MRPLRFYLVGFRVSKTINVITSLAATPPGAQGRETNGPTRLALTGREAWSGGMFTYIMLGYYRYHTVVYIDIYRSPGVHSVVVTIASKVSRARK